jgi:hypothetical protein
MSIYIEMANSKQRTLELRYEWDGMERVQESLKWNPGMPVRELVRFIKQKPQVSQFIDEVVDIAVFYGELQLDVNETFAQCNLRDGVKLTVKKIYNLPPSSPSPEPESEAEVGVSQKAPAPA